MIFQRRWYPMDVKERWSFFGKGSYNECESAFFIWVFTMTLLHYRWPFVGVEITSLFEPSKSTYFKNMILLFYFILCNEIFYNYFLYNVLFTMHCHYPLLMHGCVNHEFPEDLWHAIFKISALAHWITPKDIHVASIPRWRQEIAKILCIFEK